MRQNIISIAILIASNVCFFGWLGLEHARRGRKPPVTKRRPVQSHADPSVAHPSAGSSKPGHSAHARPKRHATMFPIAGMPDYTDGPEQACPTLSRLLNVMDEQIQDAGGQPPLTGPFRERLLEGSCSLVDPELAATLGIYRDTFGQHGLRPLPPFSYFGSPAEVGLRSGPPPPKADSPASRAGDEQ